MLRYFAHFSPCIIILLLLLPLMCWAKLGLKALLLAFYRLTGPWVALVHVWKGVKSMHVASVVPSGWS